MANEVSDIANEVSDIANEVSDIAYEVSDIAYEVSDIATFERPKNRAVQERQAASDSFSFSPPN
jgi:hypothetical protein